jgi:hypothetical protein
MKKNKFFKLSNMLGMIGIITTIVFGSKPNFEVLFTSSLLITAFRSICFITAILLSLWLFWRNVILPLESRIIKNIRDNDLNDVFPDMETKILKILYDNGLHDVVAKIASDLNSTNKRIRDIEILIKILDAEKIIKDEVNNMSDKMDIEHITFNFAKKYDMTISEAESFINPFFNEIGK